MFVDEMGQKWYKGNLHTHSTCSDGRLTPHEVAELYQKAGYDFLALTDHWVFGNSWQRDDFLMLTGCEFDYGQAVEKEGIFHIVGIGMERMPAKIRKKESPP